MTRVVSIERDGADVARGALEECIRGGGAAVFPADTLYGLACDPADGAAVERIHGIKGRDEGKPSAVMYFRPLAMRELLSTVSASTREAIAALLPGPVTLVVANPGRLYPLACREDPQRLGIRLIEGPLAGAGCAIFQTSANRSGEPAPAAFDQVGPSLLDSADLAIDAGVLGGAPSTVVDVTGIDAGRWTVLRKGALPEAAVAAALRSSVGRPG
jgi:L-threonylcarbamoyladenylate synthase